MNWTNLDDKERTRLILQHVMGCFVLKETATGWNTPAFPRGEKLAATGFHWPIAFWNTDGECWMTRDIATAPTIFDPLHDLNDAWTIVECFQTAYVNIYFIPQTYTRCNILYYDGDRTFTATEETAPLAICRTALYALGVIDVSGQLQERR